MDPQRNKDTLQRLYDTVMNAHDLDAADALITVDRPDNDPTFPPELREGRAGFKRLFGMLIGAFPDLRFTTDFMVAEDDMVTAFTKIEGRTTASSWGSRRPASRSRSTTPTPADSPMTG